MEKRNITIHKISQIKGKKPVVVLGFPGTGLVGSVAATQLVDSLDLKFVGYISSPEFAPLAAIHDYTPMPAARIHYSEKHNIVVVLSEMSIPVKSSLELAETIFEFAKGLNASAIVSLGGIALSEGSGKVYVVSSNKKLPHKLISKKLVKPIREGATTGVTGVLLSMGALRKFPVMTILAESSEDYLDPSAAVKVIKTLSAFLGVEISTADLDKEAKELAEELKDKIIKSKVPKRKGEPSGSMYG